MPFNFSEEAGDSITDVSSRFDVVVSGYIPEHDEDVLQSFLEGYSSYNSTQFSGRTNIHSSTSIVNSLSFAKENEFDLEKYHGFNIHTDAEIKSGKFKVALVKSTVKVEKSNKFFNVT